MLFLIVLANFFGLLQFELSMKFREDVRLRAPALGMVSSAATKTGSSQALPSEPCFASFRPSNAPGLPRELCSRQEAGASNLQETAKDLSEKRGTEFPVRSLELKFHSNGSEGSTLLKTRHLQLGTRLAVSLMGQKASIGQTGLVY